MVVIGIVDSGVETAHPDLVANIWKNPGENGLDNLGRDKRTNGIDDDGNGYVDDWKGWDFGGSDYNNPQGDNTPDPTASNNDHGTHVAGIAAAVGNNGTGVAGVAYRCRILPVKTAADNDTRDGGSGLIIAGYEGIAYAAYMGASVINCSWTGSGASQLEQDVISYATQQGALVVAAAGNNNSSLPHYPASYEGVISVAATNTVDGRASFSNYGPTLDVAAPGVSIVSTLYPDTYASWQGTSMASPMAAGVAALIKSVRKNFLPLQLGEQLRMTCDNIDGANPGFSGQLGGGRVNAFRAVTESPSSIRAVRFAIRDSSGGNNNGSAEPGEFLDVQMTLVNYLAPSGNAVATLSTTTAGLSVVNGTASIGVLGTLDSVSGSLFRLQVSPTVAPGLLASVKVTVTDGAASSSQNYSFVLNPTFQTHTINNLTLTLTNNGRLGFNDFPNNTEGAGCIFPGGGENALYEGGLLIGLSSTKLVDNVRNGAGGQDDDFQSEGFFKLATPGVLSDQDGGTLFADTSASPANRIGIVVNERSFSFSDQGNDDYVVIAYTLRNVTPADLTGLYVGLFLDWDIGDYASNRTAYDPSRGLAYAWDDSNPSAPYYSVCALDGAAGARGLVNSPSLTLDRQSKWGWMTEGTAQSVQGPADIHSVISSGPFSIPSDDSLLVGFAIIGGTGLPDIQINADSARTRWSVLRSSLDSRVISATPTRFELRQNYPNPFNNQTTIEYTIAGNGAPGSGPVDVQLALYNILGQEVALLVHEPKSPGTYPVTFDATNFPTGVYFYRISAGTFSSTRKLIVLK